MDSDDTQAERIADLEQSLIDERALRAEAQRRVRELDDRAALWRKRAEQRADRISKLERDRDQSAPTRWLDALRRARRGSAPGSVVETSGSSMVTARLRAPAIPGTSIVHNATGPLATVLGQGNAAPLESRPWDSVDLVVLDPARVTEDDLGRYRRWIDQSPRPPVVVVTDDPAQWPSADAIVGSGSVGVPNVIDVSSDDEVDLPGAAATVADGEAMVSDSDGSPVGVLVESGSDGYAEISEASLQLASLGVPIGTSVEQVLDAGQGSRARRWSWQHRDPAVVLHRLLVDLDVHHRSPWPSVAGLLISNRPDRVVGAINGFLAQGYPHKELVVGCHGFDSEAVREQLGSNDIAVRMQVLEFPRSWSLGRCLNEAAESTTATLVAKIDDDDYYGPSYLLDAVLAHRYSGAEVVGKGAQFTYVESSDTTVLRRPTTEETPVDGVLTGASLVFERAVWDAVRFPDRPRMVDIHFLAGARAAGARVYAASRWEFVYRRTVSGHTWEVDDEQFLAGSEPAWTGWDPHRCILTDLA